MRSFLMICCLLILAGCGPKYQLVKNTGVDPSESARLVVYRPDASFHKYNPEEPFVYVNGKKVGSLGVGETLETQIHPGKNTVVLKGSILFMPAFKLGEIEIVAKRGQEYFVRYSYEFSYLVGTSAVGESSLHLVDPNIGRQKR